MKFKNSAFAWLLAIIFLSMQVIILSQDNTYNNTKRDKTKSENKKNDQYKSGENMNDNSEIMKQARYDFADKMAKNLMSKIGLTLEETEKVRDVLIDYQEDVMDVRERYSNNTMAGTAKENNNKNGTTSNKTDNTPITNDNNNEVVGGNNTDENDKIEAYQDADRDANDKIENALEETKITQYNSIKKDWWSQIKNHIHSVKISKVEKENDNLNINRNDGINPGPNNR
jgi:hypothetical protein